MNLLEAYVKSVLVNELHVDKDFIRRLRSTSNTHAGYAQRGRSIAQDWINNAENLGAVFTLENKRDIQNYAAWRYAKLFHKLNDNSVMADQQMYHMIDLKFSSWLDLKV
jgi:hypothetical protein